MASSTSQNPTSISFSSEEINNASVCSGHRPSGAAESSKRKYRSQNVHWKVVSPSTLRDPQVDERAPEREAVTLIRDSKADKTSVGAVQYKINLPSKVTVPRKTAKEENKSKIAAGRVHVNARTHKGNIKAVMTLCRDVHLASKTAKGENGRKTSNGDNNTVKRERRTCLTSGEDISMKSTCGECDSALKRGHGGHVTLFGYDDKTLSGDGNNSLNRDRDRHSSSIGDHPKRLRIPLCSEPTTLTPKLGFNTLK